MAGSIRTEMALSDWARLLLLGSLWGGSFFFARVAVIETGPLLLVLARVGIAALAMHLYLLVSGQSFRDVLPHWRLLALLALVNNIIPFSLIFLGQTVLGAGIASVLNATTPFWTLILSTLFLPDERMTWNKLCGILMGLAGTALTIGPGLVAGLGGPNWAKFALIGAALSYGFALLVARRLKVLAPPLIATGQFTASTIMMLPVAILAGGFGPLVAASTSAWLAILALALVSTAFAYILYFGLVASAGATNTSLVTLVVPVSAILLGSLLLHERLEAYELAGMAVIGLGLVVIDGRLFRRRRRSAAA